MTISRRDFIASTSASIAGASIVPVLAAEHDSGGSAHTRDALLLPRTPTGRDAPPASRLDPWIEVDPQALAHNVGQIRRLTGRPILAVLKNNAYGLGLTVVASHLEPMPEIAGFAVVRADEAVALRDAGVRKPVLLMARAATADVPDLGARDIELCVTEAEDPARLAAALSTGRSAEPAGQTAQSGALAARVHLYLDTGMSRMGVRWDEGLVVARELIAQLTATPESRATGARGRSLEVAGTFMAFTEEPDFDREQLQRFQSFVEEARREGFESGRLHAASSNGVFHLPEAHLDMVRPGIAIFGAYPSRPDEERAKAELIPAVRLKARVVRVARLEPGESVSYGRNYVAKRRVRIATLPVGHADGYPRQAVDGARVLIGGKTYPVIGAVSASHTIIEVGDIEPRSEVGGPAVEVGDIATLMGPDVPEVHPNAIAATIGVSVYDLLMHLSPLLPRVEV